MTSTTIRPPFDPELEAALGIMRENMPATLTVDMIPAMRAVPLALGGRETIEDAGLVTRDVTISGHDGAEIVLSIIQRPDRTGTGPGIYHAHGGGMIVGDRWAGVAGLARWAHELNAVIVTVEYRLAPEHPDPTPVEDCYAGLVWTAAHAAELGVDLDRLMIGGGSAGGGLAAGTALLARDRGGPALRAQLLMCPMLDDRDTTVSTRQIDGVGVWDRGSNVVGWSALLGDRRGTDDVSIYAAPGRAVDLSGLPPAYIDCGSAEVFRDEDVAYATRIWEAGGQAELHVWAGGFHGFEMVPQAAISQAAVAARDSWIARMLGR
ncbi:acetyl esterase/lipase [Microbacterium resistens]|uniref:Acetyl esterase/lipase n=1 Tax=Microbacterium resistens TaxID=156977 RepID=A0ABU1SAQ0_9MICO|nr:alpha/beta hydrolase [Microbacterium resistens]MDR6866644.1 acetyl esterase/lipase [Microbacterium resistens]